MTVQPRLEAGPPQPQTVVAWLIGAALEGIAENCGRGQRALPATLRFRREDGMALCFGLTHDDVFGAGAMTLGTGVGGTWRPVGHFEEELRLELERARGFTHRELDDATGLPAVA